MASKNTRDIVYTDDHPILPVTMLRRLLGTTIFTIILGLIAVFLLGLTAVFQINLMGLGLATSVSVSAVAGLFIYDKTNKYERISRNKNSEVLAKKATSENINVLTMIAANSNTDSETLQKLSERTDVDVLDYVILDILPTAEAAGIPLTRFLDFRALVGYWPHRSLPGHRWLAM